MVEIITPLMTQLGVGGIVGLCVGYALKKIGKLIAILVGIAFLGLELLAYKGIISINYSALEEWARNLIVQIGATEGILTLIIGNIPFASIFLVGLAIGLKTG